MNISKNHFGTTPEGHEAFLYSLKGDAIEARITNYGGAVTSIVVPDRNGKLGDVVLGYDTLPEYLDNPRYLGALIGRFANRIAEGRFTLNDVRYQLAQNNGANHLHGGLKGFDKVVWQATETVEDGNAVLRLKYFSKDGEEYYPGNLDVEVTYMLSDDGELRIDYRAVTDKTTIINLTNHSYFNLAGAGTILSHEISLNADAFTPIGPQLIPTGEILDVDETPMDFRNQTAIGARVDDSYEQLSFAQGYDHNFVLHDFTGLLRQAAAVVEPVSGRTLEVLTTQPGLQFYSGNFFDGTLKGKGGVFYKKRSGFCLETQHFPDSPNHPHFPTTVLQPEDVFSETTVFRFGVE
ncbi:MAG TPA: aldose epimerase family protein [Pyrinomonadaceae bacterium]|nr:aldose epimerase family protein [Pyrinomonadaceae bacterium]